MSVRTALSGGLTRAAKAIGSDAAPGAAPAPARPMPAASLPAGHAMRQAAEDTSWMGPQHPFSPGEPIRPYDGYSRNPRSHDFQTAYNISTRPRTHERVSFGTLRGLVESYDVAQIAIWHRIDSIRSLDWQLIADDGFNDDVTDAVKIGKDALKRPDRQRRFKTWLAEWLYDVLAYDAGTLYRMRNYGGQCIGLKVVDGTTIAPLLDYWGDSPEDPTAGPDEQPEAYVQYANGLPWNWLTRNDLIYEPFRPRANSPYGTAPLESIMLNANTDIRFQLYFLQRFTDGNIPEAFAAAPESWDPDQIERFQEHWDSLIYGDQAAKHQIRWMPGGSGVTWTNEKEFTDTFSLFLMRKTCAAYHVVPSDLGFTETVNLSSSESQADVQHRVGELPLETYVEDILTGFLQDDLGLPLRFQFDKGEEQDDRLAQAQADQIYIEEAVVSASEVREMRFGLPEPEGQIVPRIFMTSRAGPVPLSSLMGVAGKVDPETGAPDPRQPLPHQAFTEVPGVVPNPPLIEEPLAEDEYGPSAIPPAPPPQPQAVPEATDPNAPKVAKEAAPAAGAGATAGITAETGIYGDPLIRDDEDEPERRQLPSAAKVATTADGTDEVRKEMAAFRRFQRGRAKAGAWRDFQFRSVPAVSAHRLNDAGRLAVRKAAGEIAVAGLAVQAQDTGRVLMLQRALTDGDPAAGCWEFPGGHLEDGETPLQAAWREWAEETGCIPPPGNVGGGWSSGIYQGIVWQVESEAMVPVRCDTAIANPDDPDGDMVEAIAWWEPGQLASNPAVRSELQASLDMVLAALGQGDGEPRDLEPAEGAESVCPCGTPVVYDAMNGWQHADGSVSHDDGESVSDKMAAAAPVVKAGGVVPKAASPSRDNPAHVSR